jgi:hypothetical protein
MRCKLFFFLTIGLATELVSAEWTPVVRVRDQLGHDGPQIINSGLMFKSSPLDKSFAQSGPRQSIYILTSAHGVFQDSEAEHTLTVSCRSEECGGSFDLSAKLLAVHFSWDTALLQVVESAEHSGLIEKIANLVEEFDLEAEVAPKISVEDQVTLYGYPVRSDVMNSTPATISSVNGQGHYLPEVSHTIELNGEVDPAWSGGFAFKNEGRKVIGMLSRQVLVHTGEGLVPILKNRNVVKPDSGDIELIELVIPIQSQLRLFALLVETQGKFQARLSLGSQLLGPSSFTMSGLKFEESRSCSDGGAEVSYRGDGVGISGTPSLFGGSQQSNDKDNDPKPEHSQLAELDNFYSIQRGDGVGISSALQDTPTASSQQSSDKVCSVTVSWDESSSRLPWSATGNQLRETPVWIQELKTYLEIRPNSVRSIVAIEHDKELYSFGSIFQLLNAISKHGALPLFALETASSEAPVIRDEFKKLHDVTTTLTALHNILAEKKPEFAGRKELPFLIKCLNFRVQLTRSRETFGQVLSSEFVRDLVEIDYEIAHNLVKEIKKARSLYERLSN